MFEHNYAKLNVSRITSRITKSNMFLSGSTNKSFKLSSKKENELTSRILKLSDNEEIESFESLLPINLFTELNQKKYIRLVKQINATYENNLFDACALMMRRLLELLLIEYIESLHLQNLITNTDGDYIKFSVIINRVKSSSTISLTNKLYDDLHLFRKLGNLSAHKNMFYLRKNDISKNELCFRVLVEELLRRIVI